MYIVYIFFKYIYIMIIIILSLLVFYKLLAGVQVMQNRYMRA